MDFPDPLLRGTLIKRYKRFMADVVLECGDTVTAHCANTGAMLGVQNPGSEVWLSPARNPDRKLKFTWEMIRIGESLVGINTAHPNKIVAEAIEAGKIPELSGYGDLRREVKYGTNSRIDILLSEDGKPDCYVEIKNVHLMRDTGVASQSTRNLSSRSQLNRGTGAGAGRPFNSRIAARLSPSSASYCATAPSRPGHSAETTGRARASWPHPPP